MDIIYKAPLISQDIKTRLRELLEGTRSVASPKMSPDATMIAEEKPEPESNSDAKQLHEPMKDKEEPIIVETKKEEAKVTVTAPASQNEGIIKVEVEMAVRLFCK